MKINMKAIMILMTGTITMMTKTAQNRQPQLATGHGMKKNE